MGGADAVSYTHLDVYKRQARVCVAFLPRKWADSLFFVANMASRTFAKFVSGQCTEACILGTLCWLGMSLLRLPYAPMIGALVGICLLYTSRCV